jgi:cyanobactin biosynthesis protein (PatB/AcyB/McaB family)
MRLPLQSPPVRRPELIHPHRTVDLVHGSAEELVALRTSLMHGANYNDPQYFCGPGMQCQSVASGGPS